MPPPLIHEDLAPQWVAARNALRVAGDGELLQARSGLRAVVRIDDVVVKMYAASESDYWEREIAAHRALAHSDLAPVLRATGELWIATDWVNLKSPDSVRVEMYSGLGGALALLHSQEPRGLPTLSMSARLQKWLDAGPDGCPPKLLSAAGRMLMPLCAAYRETHFVHGDWDFANVLVSPESAEAVRKVVDFEGSHLGDPAEDFKWQLLEGPPWASYGVMLDGYQSAGGYLGSNATERLVLAAAEWSLDVLTWKRSFGSGELHEVALNTLDALTSGEWPDTPR